MAVAKGEITFDKDKRKHSGVCSFILNEEFLLKQVDISADSNGHLRTVCILDGSLIEKLRLDDLSNTLEPIHLDPLSPRILGSKWRATFSGLIILERLFPYLKVFVPKDGKLYHLFKTLNSILKDFQKEHIWSSWEMLTKHAPMDEAIKESLESEDVFLCINLIDNHYLKRFSENTSKDFLAKMLEYAKNIEHMIGCCSKIKDEEKPKAYLRLQPLVVKIKYQLTPLHSMTLTELQEAMHYERTRKAPDKPTIDSINALIEIKIKLQAQAYPQELPPPAFNEPPLYDAVESKQERKQEIPESPDEFKPLGKIHSQQLDFPQGSNAAENSSAKRQVTPTSTALKSIGFLSSSSSSFSSSSSCQWSSFSKVEAKAEMSEDDLLKDFFVLYAALALEPENQALTKCPDIETLSLGQIVSHARLLFSPKSLLSYACTMSGWVNSMGEICNKAPQPVKTAYKDARLELAYSVRVVMPA